MDEIMPRKPAEGRSDALWQARYTRFPRELDEQIEAAAVDQDREVAWIIRKCVQAGYDLLFAPDADERAAPRRRSA